MRLPGSTNAYRLHIVLKKVPKTSTEDGHVRAIDEDVYKPRSDGRGAVLHNRIGAMFLSVLPRMTV